MSPCRRLLACTALTVAGAGLAGSAHAADPGDDPIPPPPPPSEAAEPFQDRWVLDTGRMVPGKPVAGEITGSIHGQYQLWLRFMSDLPLPPMTGEPTTATLGQTLRVEHRLRVTPRLHLSDAVSLVAQADVPYGFLAGDTTRFLDEAREPYAETNGFRLAPRWLYAEWNSPVGVLRVGQQPSHWGLGLLANDGDHPSLFGELHGGSITERVAFATQPLGRDVGWGVAIAGDYVFQDATARLVDDDEVWQGVLATWYETRAGNRVGVYGVYRTQTRERTADGRTFEEGLDVIALDTHGRFRAPIPGVEGHAFGEVEVAWIFGDTSFTRTVTQSFENRREDISQVGAAARVGVALTRGVGEESYGWLVPQLEWGWASGDANPHDGTTKRFRFDPNFNVGLILFDEALAWRTARAAAIASDPGLSARPSPGLDLLPSNGAVFSATYLNPTVVYRPLPELDLKLGAVLAQSTADVVDPVQLATSGQYVNWDGGPARSRDLGVELDLGVDGRIDVCECARLTAGAQGGLLFPGGAFDDAQGNGPGTQWVAVTKLGVEF